MSKVMIYSNEHKGWWKPYYFGYTQCSKEAGIFDLEDAIKKYPKLDYDTSNEDFLVDVSIESIDNSTPSEALECLETIWCDISTNYVNEYTTIKQALLKAQEQEKEKLLFKNIHNTKVKTPLVSIFEGLSKDERFKFTEHIYYHWEEMKEALEDKNIELEKENVELKAKAQKEHKALEIIKNKTVDIWLIQNKKTLKQYNLLVDESRQLTQEEFDLLKEVLENESKIL